MAYTKSISGYIQGKGTSPSRYQLILALEYTQNISDNTSTVNAKGYIQYIGTEGTVTGPGEVNFHIGTNKYKFSNVKYTLKPGVNTLIFQKNNIILNHNADGTRKVFLYFGVNGNPSNINKKRYPMGFVRQENVELFTIPTPSEIYTNTSFVSVGESIIVNIKKGVNKAVRHNITLTLLGKNKSISAHDIETSTSLTIPDSWKYDIHGRNAAKIECETYAYNRNNAIVGRNSIDITVMSTDQPDEGGGDKPDKPITIPECISHTISPSDYYTYSYFGNKYVAGKIDILLDVQYKLPTSNSTSTYFIRNIYTGEDILSQTVSYDNGDIVNFKCNTNELSSTVALGCYCINNNEKSDITRFSEIEVLNYYSPIISSVKAYKADAYGNPNEKSTEVYISFDYNIAPLDNKNIKSYRIQYAPFNSNDWQTINSIPSMYGYNGNISFNTNDFSYGLNLKSDTSYRFKIEVTDYFETATNAGSALSELVLMEFNASGKGMSIGKASEDPNSLEIALPMKISKLNDSPILSLVGNKSINIINYDNSYGQELVLGDASINTKIQSNNELSIISNNGFITTDSDGMTISVPALKKLTLSSDILFFNGNINTSYAKFITTTTLGSLKFDKDSKVDFTGATVKGLSLSPDISGKTYTGVTLNDSTFYGTINWTYTNKPTMNVPKDLSLKTLTILSENNKIPNMEIYYNTASGLKVKTGLYTDNTNKLEEGVFTIGGKSIGHTGIPYREVSGGGDLYYGSSGAIGVLKSSRRFKHDIVKLNDLIQNEEEVKNKFTPMLMSINSTPSNNANSTPVRTPVLNPKDMLKLDVYQFKYNKDIFEPEEQDTEYANSDHVSFIAEDVAQYCPEAAVYTNGEIQTWKMQPVLLGTFMLVKEQQKEINDLKNRLEALESASQNK